MIEEARKILRITTNAFDAEIQDLLDAAESDLVLAGVLSEKFTKDDPLIRRALLTYVKAHFGWNNTDHDRLIIAYATIKQHLLLSGEYTNV